MIFHIAFPGQFLYLVKAAPTVVTERLGIWNQDTERQSGSISRAECCFWGPQSSRLCAAMRPWGPVR